MPLYNTLNLKLSKVQINKLKRGIKNGSKVTLNSLQHVISDSNDETNFTHNLLLTVKRVSRLRKTFTNNSSAKINLSRS